MAGTIFVNDDAHFGLGWQGIDRFAIFTQRKMSVEDWEVCKVAYEPHESLECLFLHHLSPGGLQRFHSATKLACAEYERDFCDGVPCDWWREIIAAIEADPRFNIQRKERDHLTD